MLDLIARLIGLPLGLLFPPAGRHRPRQVIPRPATTSALRQPRVRPRAQAAEERWKRAELRLRRQRRRALWLAVHGVDIGPRVIHGVAVTR